MVHLSIYCIFYIINKGPVAQLVRAPALQAGGQEFESPQVHHIELERKATGNNYQWLYYLKIDYDPDEDISKFVTGSMYGSHTKK